MYFGSSASSPSLRRMLLYGGPHRASAGVEPPDVAQQMLVVSTCPALVEGSASVPYPLAVSIA